MPRKPKPGMQLIIEGLSDGKRGLVDDFTGQPIPEPNAKPIASASVTLDKRNRDKATAQRALLQAVGMLPPDPVVYVKPGHRLTTVIKDIAGNELTISSPIPPKKPFRRI